VCVVVAALAIPLSVCVLWVTGSIDSEGAFVGTLAPLAKNATVTSTVTDEVTSALVSLAGRIPVALSTAVVRSEVAKVVEGPPFPAIWTAALRSAYPAVRSMSNGQLGAGEPVVVNLTPVVQAVVRAALGQVPSAFTLPQVAVTLVPVSRVARASQIVHDVISLEWILPVSATAAVVLALLLAPRRKVVILGLAVGTGLMCGALLGGLAALHGGIVNETRGGDGFSAASVSVLDELSGPLRIDLYITIAIVAAAALVVLAWSTIRSVLRRS
jgi:hypothetical protein